MCGITGFNWDDRDLVTEMTKPLIHRGPDAEGVWTEEGVSLGHRRLAVIDLSASANQPMLSATGDSVIVFNGEIYNYKELRSELASRYQFKTESDTEVILAGYEAWGESVVERLNGIFAFVIWDRREKKFFGARDSVGVKPLYYYWDGAKFIFGSELSAILIHPIPRVLNREAFSRYLRVLYSPEPETLIQSVSKLPPSSKFTLRRADLSISKFEIKKSELQVGNYREAVREVRETVESAVSRQMVADVPVGVYLSGGVDSSVVLASAVKLNPQIKTFSVGFDLREGEESEKFNQDFHLARKTAEHFGAEHHELVLKTEEVAARLEEIIGSIDDPISNPTALPMYLLAKFAKQKVTVVLSGNGGDELFGGYERYRMSVRADWLGLVPGLTRILPKKISQAVQMSALDRLAQFEFEKDRRLTSVINSDFWISGEEVKKFFSKYVRAGDKTEALMNADLSSWLPDQALLLGDKMSMRGSLEERVPLLDNEVVALAQRLPLAYKVSPFRTKKVLKDAFADVLPPELLNQPKRGWFSPGAKWLRRPEFIELTKEILSPEYYPPTSELFNWPEISKMHERHLEKKEYNLTILWAIITFQIWAKKYSIIS